MRFLRRIYSFDNDVNFRRGWRYAIALSVVLLIVSFVSLGMQGLKLGIDFKGGVAWDLPTNDQPTSAFEDVMARFGADDPQVQTLTGAGGEHVRIEAEESLIPQEREITAALSETAGIPPDRISDEVTVSTVGPSWGENVSEKAIQALIAFFIAVSIYISIRLEWKMAIGAIAGVLHDIVLSVGVYSVLRFEVTPGTVVAFLTILGYSLYDTIVVYDRVKENQSKVSVASGMTYGDMMSLSLNETFMRSINTTFSAVIPVAAILFVGSGLLGAVALEEFGIALFVGLMAGAYSSVFISAPIVSWLKEREPRNRAVREKLEKARREGTAPAPAAREPEAEVVEAAERVEAGKPSLVKTPDRSPRQGDREPEPATQAARSTGGGTRPTPSARGPYSANHPPRPRKKGKRR